MDPQIEITSMRQFKQRIIVRKPWIAVHLFTLRPSIKYTVMKDQQL